MRSINRYVDCREDPSGLAEDGDPSTVVILRNLTPDCPVNQVMQKENDELTLEEAIAKTGMVCALIDASVDSKCLMPRTLEVS